MRRGQSAFEYIVLLGGVLLIVVFISLMLRDSYQVAGNQINQTVAAAIRAGSSNVSPAGKCTGGYDYGKCITADQPKYCDAGRIIDKCQACGCPASLGCTANGTCTFKAGASPAITPPPVVTPQPADPFSTLISGILGIGTGMTQFVASAGRYGWVILLALILVIMAVLVYVLSRVKKT